MKPRSDSRLFKLTTDQQAQLYDWIHKLGYAKAKELAALPPPDGFSVNTHLNSLCRFVKRYAEMLKEREFFDIVRCAAGKLDPKVIRAAETMTHHMAFNIATDPQQDLDKFRLLSRWVLNLKDQQQEDARMNLAYERLAFLAERDGLGTREPGSCTPKSDGHT